MHHFAGDPVDLAGRESFGMFAFAAPSEKGHEKQENKWGCRAAPRPVLLSGHSYLIYCPVPNEHRALGGFFLRSLQEFEGFAEDRIFG
jgi:hypothetical protein